MLDNKNKKVKIRVIDLDFYYDNFQALKKNLQFYIPTYTKYIQNVLILDSKQTTLDFIVDSC